MNRRFFEVLCVLLSLLILVGFFGVSEEEIYLDFSGYPGGPAKSSGITSWSSSGSDKNPYYESSLRLLYESSRLTAEFYLESKPDNAALVVNHLSSKASSCKGDGYSPVTISINRHVVVSNYDVAENHGGSHGYQTDRWEVSDKLKEGYNRIKWKAEDICTHYWLKRFSIQPYESKSEGKDLWADDFESYKTSSWPDNWYRSGNADSPQNKVVGGYSSSGSKSLKLKGVPGSCWESLAFHKLGVSTQQSFTVSLDVKTTRQGQEGCHGQRGGVQIATGPDWTKDSRGLISFRTDGSLPGDLGNYEVGEWIEVKIEYSRLGQEKVKLTYWIDGSRRGSKIVEAKGFEDELSYLGIKSGDFTIYYDDVEVRTKKRKELRASLVQGSFRILNKRPEYSLGDSVKAQVAVKNTGSKRTSFFVGYSARDKYGSTHSNRGQTGKMVDLSAGEKRTVNLSWTVTQKAPPGKYDLIAAVWPDYPEKSREPFERTGWKEDVIEVSQKIGEAVPERLREKINEFRRSADQAVTISSSLVNYKGSKYQVVGYFGEEAFDWNGIRRTDSAFDYVLTSRENWKQFNTEKLLVFKVQGGDFLLVPGTKPDVIKSVLSLKARGAMPFLPDLPHYDIFVEPEYNDAYQPTERELENINEILDGWVFITQQIKKSWIQSDYDKYLVAVRQMVNQGDIDMLPDPIRNDIKGARDISEAVNIANSAIKTLDNETAVKSLEAFVKNLREFQGAVETAGKLGGILDVILEFSQYQVYADRKVEVFGNLLKITKRNSKYSLDLPLRKAIKTVVAENNSLQEKFMNKLVEFVETEVAEGTLELAETSSKELLKKFGTHLTTKVAAQVGSQTASALTTIAGSAASGIMAGLTVSNYLYNMDGMYEAGLKARYAHKASQQFDYLADRIRRRRAGEYRFEVLSEYRTMDSCRLYAISVFWQANAELLNSTWVDEAKEEIDSLIGAKNHISVAREIYHRSQRGALKSVQELYYPVGLDLALENYSSNK
ncbi:hypothetical protein KGY79_10520 [Candidatus Bipolaricaulota bacterium]|nr:hypothetical protein [Candidatus Bipolaricaulota bacterium]